MELIALFFLTMIWIFPICAKNKDENFQEKKSLKATDEKHNFFDLLEKEFDSKIYFDLNPDFELTGGGKIHIPYFDTGIFFTPKGINSGFSATTEKILKNHEFGIKAGNISYSKAISKLHNPLISSSASPFYSADCNVSAISAILPTSSSSMQAFSAFFFAEYNSKNKIQNLKFTGLTIPRDKAALNGSVKIKGKNVIIAFSSTNEFFNFFQNGSTSWFAKDWFGMKDFYFHQDIFFNSLNQISISANKYSSLFSVGFYQSPKGFFTTILKSENKIKVGKMSFSFSGLANKNQISSLTGSGKKIDDCIQGKLGGIYNFTVKKEMPYFYKIGGTAYFKKNLNPTSENKSREIKCSLGNQIVSPFMRFSVAVAIESENTYESYKIALPVKFFCYFENATPGITTDFSYQKSSGVILTKQNLKISCGLFKNPNIFFSINFVISQKEFEFDDLKMDCTVSAKWTLDKISMQGKLKSDFNFP